MSGFDRGLEPALGIVAMQMWQLTMLFVLGLTCFAMGFVALLKQKLYIDSKTKQPTEVSLPFLGKMKTNYPALVFVFVGAAAMYEIYSFKQPDVDDKTEYLVTGKIQLANASTIGGSPSGVASPDFSKGSIVPYPRDISDTNIESSGNFLFTIKIPKQKKFEDEIQILQLTHPNFVGSVYTNNPATLTGSSANSRAYKFLVEPSLPPSH
jgi:hypothetical protein